MADAPTLAALPLLGESRAKAIIAYRERYVADFPNDVAYKKVEDLKGIYFRINSGYSKDLRDALDPQPQQKKSKRVRRE